MLEVSSTDVSAFTNCKGLKRYAGLIVKWFNGWKHLSKNPYLSFIIKLRVFAPLCFSVKKMLQAFQLCVSDTLRSLREKK
jgi:hypothetical protein